MKELIERYYQGLTTLDEERQLAAHFAAHPSDDEHLFSSLHLLRGADTRGRGTGGGGVPASALRDQQRRRGRLRPQSRLRPRYLTRAAAALLIAISASYFLLRPAPADLGCYPPDLTPEQALATINDAFAQVDHAKTATLNALTI